VRKSSRAALIAAVTVATMLTPVSAGAAELDLAAPSHAEMSGAKMIFRDEFSGRRLNRDRWSTLRGESPGYGSPYNPRIEGAAYSRRNVSVRSGAARLTLRRGSAPGYRSYAYNSGMIHSAGSFAFKHGYVEARVRVPRCSGCWPAFWMLEAPVDRFWPPEIDIFEFFNTDADARPFFNYHYLADGQHEQSGPASYGEGGQVGEWHTYGLRWTATSLQVFLDGVPGPTFRDADRLPTRAAYLIFNLGMYRNREPRSGSKMAIDWVRVWQ
jgi:beta-glucanase (GH16 family)